MANKPKSMLQVRRILQLLSDGHSKREASRQTGTSRNTIDSYELRFQGSGKSYDELLHLDYFLNELSRTGVTRELLWNEYRQSAPESYSYSQFCDLLSRHSYKKSPVYHNTYIPGELVEIDFAGKKMSYVDRSTGEVVECPVLVCTLPYSSFSYIEPLASGKLDHLVPRHEPCSRILWRRS
jgi:transposase